MTVDAVNYVVQSGDTITRIVRRNGVNWTAFMCSNPQISEMDYLVPGQVVQIPQRLTNIYVIQPKDTFDNLSTRFNIPPDELLAANPALSPNNFKEEQIIVLPHSRGVRIVNSTAPYGYIELREDLLLLQQVYPFIEIENIGRSVMGKNIWAVKVGSGPKEIHYNGAFHGNEWITSVLLMKFIEEYAEACHKGVDFRGINAAELYEATTLWVVPMVNPDGVELVQEGVTPQHPYYDQLMKWNQGSSQFNRWKANIRGRDLNDQFPAHWEEERDRRARKSPGPKDYGGETPLTEPEAVAMFDFAMRHHFRLVMSFHTQGQEIYWNYRNLEPQESFQIASKLAEVSGYRAVKLTESDAGYKDWFIQCFHKPGFTIEAGIGTTPLPLTQFPDIYEDVAALMLQGLIV